MACIPKGPAYQVIRVQQFTFSANNEVLACIYDKLRAIEDGHSTANSVNIRGYFQSEIESGNLVKIFPCNPFEDQTEKDLELTENVLQKFCVKYTKETVSLVSPACMPVENYRVQTLMNAIGVKIIASYNDKSTSSIYQVSNLSLATNALILNICQQDEIINEVLKCKDVRKENCSTCGKKEGCNCKKEETKCHKCGHNKKNKEKDTSTISTISKNCNCNKNK